MDLGLTGRIAAVAAASDGLGKAVAERLACEGARVAICSRDLQRVQSAARDIEAAARSASQPSPQIFACAIDLSSGSGPADFIRETERRFGGLDILIANCGGPPPGRAADLTDDAWKQGIDLTLLSSVRLARAAVPLMQVRRWGRIVFITSVSVKQPIENLALSTALRSGVTGFAKALADEVAASGITVNSVAPGSTATGRLEALLARRAADRGISLEQARSDAVASIPMKRIGKPEELAAAVAFLVSEPAAFITGTVLPVDGGQCRSIQ